MRCFQPNCFGALRVWVVLACWLGSLGSLSLPRLTAAQVTPINSNVVIVGHLNVCTTGPSGTTGSAYACTLGYAITAYQPQACYAFVADVANTGSATLNLHSLGAKTISKVVGGVTTALAANDIRVGHRVTVCYDATNDRMQMQGPVGNPPSFTELSGTASDAQIPHLNTLSTGLTASRCVETDGDGLLTSTAGACGSGGGTPGGSPSQVQYNNAGAFGGSSGVTFDATSLLSTAPRITSVTASKTLDTTDGPLVNCAPATASNVTLTLPVAATTTQRRLSVIKSNATTTFGQCLVDGNGSETINGSTNSLAAATQFSRVDCDLDKTTATANWSCVAGKTALDLATDVTGRLPYANVQAVSVTNRVLGRVTAGAGDIEELTALQVRDLLYSQATFTDAIYIPAGSLDVEGTCALGSAATLVTNGPKLAAITCADTDTDGIQAEFLMPDGWNAGTLTVSLAVVYAGTTHDAHVFDMNFSGQCVRHGDTVAAFAVLSGATAESASNVEVQFTATDFTATANRELAKASSALTLAGTCAAGAHVYLHGLVDAGSTTFTPMSELRIVGLKVEFVRNASD